MFSGRAVLIAAGVALLVGALATLALRPPGGGAAPAAAGTAGQPGDVRIRWRVPLSAARNLPGSGETPVWLAETLASSTAGAVRLDLYDPGELAPAFAITDAVRDRKVQAGFTWLGYDQGKIAASALFGATPFGLDPWAYIGWWFFGDGEVTGKALAEGIYAKLNTRPVLCGISGPETAGWFRFPLESSEDLQGLKIRFAGLGGKVMDRVGASITMLPAGEIFQALEWRDGPFEDFRGAYASAPKERPLAGSGDGGKPGDADYSR
jgi:TRAP-type mannitol/chloroaromatic compound transport system substrate-binding protein